MHYRNRNRLNAGVELLESRRLLASSELDVTYGLNGDAAVGEWIGEYLTDAVMLNDGSVIAAGANFGDGFVVAKLSVDGDLDTSFGNQGWSTADVAPYSRAMAVAIAPDGKIILAGSVRNPTTDIAVVRFNANGSLDTSFGTAGTVYVGINNNYDECTELAVQADGSIVLAGTTGVNHPTSAMLVGLTPSGALNPAFGTNGFVFNSFMTAPQGEPNWVSVMAMPDGKLVTAGVRFSDPNQATVARFLKTGELDTSFGVGGYFRSEQRTAWDITPAPGGGFFVLTDRRETEILRLTADGALDTSWGMNGVSEALPDELFSSYPHSLKVAVDGSIYVSDGSYNLMIKHFLANGEIDDDFGSAGVLHAFPTEQRGEVVIQPDGKLIGVGGRNGFQVRRYIGSNDRPNQVAHFGARVVVSGTDAIDALVIEGGEDEITVSINAIEHVFAREDVERIDIRLDESDDLLTVHGNVPLGAVELGDGNDTMTYTGGVAAATAATVYGNGGNDLLDLSIAQHNVTFNGGAGTDTVSVLGSEQPDFIRRTDGRIDFDEKRTRFVTYTSVEKVELNGAGGDDAIFVDVDGGDGSQTRPGSDGTVRGGGGNDVITTAGTARLTIIGEGGDDELVTTKTLAFSFVNYDGGAGSNLLTMHELKTLNVTDGGNHLIAGLDLVFANVAEANLYLIAAGANTVIRAVPQGMQMNIRGGAGPDSFATFDCRLTTGLLLDGGGGNDVWDATDASPIGTLNTYALDQDHLMRNGVEVNRFVSVERLDFGLSLGSNSLVLGRTDRLNEVFLVTFGSDSVISADPALASDHWANIVRIHGGNGNDTIILPESRISNLFVHGGNGNDSFTYIGGSGVDTFDFLTSNTTFKITHPAGVINAQYSGFETMAFEGNDGADVFNFTGSAWESTTLLKFLGGAGDDIFNIGYPVGLIPTFIGGPDTNTMNASGGTFTLPADLGANGSLVNVNVTGGSLRFPAGTNRLGALRVSTGAVALQPGGNSLLIVRELRIGSTARVDLSDNDMIVDYAESSELGAIQALINRARGFGQWTSPGLTSSAARDASPGVTTLGAMEATEYKALAVTNTTFDGEPIDSSAVLVKYTYYGDANFSGRVNFDDYARIDRGFSQRLSGWVNGDFDGNGLINFDDYTLIDLSFNANGPQLRPAPAPMVSPRSPGGKGAPPAHFFA